MVARCLLLLALSALPARAASTVRVEVALGEHTPKGTLQAEGVWLGEPVTWTLKDDGVGFDRRAADGVWSGGGSGEELRALSLTVLEVRGSGDRVELWSGTERLPTGLQVVTLAAFERPQGLALRRSAIALPGPAMEFAEATGIAALLGWTAVLLVFVIGLVVASMRPRRR
jgi:hypothetical protein